MPMQRQDALENEEMVYLVWAGLRKQKAVQVSLSQLCLEVRMAGVSHSFELRS